ADIALIEAVLPSVSLAIMAQAGHGIAAGLLGAYLGGDAARRVHAGAVERGSVRRIRAALWFADIRGFTALADAHPGLAVIEMLDEVFETLAAPLRPRGGEGRRDLPPRARRRGRGEGGARPARRGAGRRRKAGRRGRSRAASRRGAV